MIKNPIRSAVLILCVAAAASFAWMQAAPAPQQPTVSRKILLRQDTVIPGYEEAMVAVEIPVGGREGRHTHPGSAMIYVLEGALTLDYEGKATTTYNPGDSIYVEPGKVHEGINNGKTPIKVVATFLLKKGEPMTSPAK